MIKCSLCEALICKYALDLGDTIIINTPNMKSRIGTVEKYICDDCAKKIAKELIER